MKKLQNSQYKKHILVCVNNREQGECCARVDGQQVYEKIKEYVRNNGLTGIIWVTRTRCLGFCNSEGTTIVIYPDKKWFTEVTLKDVNLVILELMQGIAI